MSEPVSLKRKAVGPVKININATKRTCREVNENRFIPKTNLLRALADFVWEYSYRYHYAYQFNFTNVLVDACKFVELDKDNFAFTAVIFGHTSMREQIENEDERLATVIALAEGFFRLGPENKVRDLKVYAHRVDLVGAGNSTTFVHGDNELSYHFHMALDSGTSVVSVAHNSVDLLESQTVLNLPTLTSGSSCLLIRIVNKVLVTSHLEAKPPITLC